MMEKEVKSIELWRSVMAECLAVFLYVFLGCSVLVDWDPRVFRVAVSTADLLHVALAFGLTLCTLTQCFGHISGGQFNPALTLGAVVTCKLTPLRGVLYVIAQCGGGIAGAALLYGLAPEQARGNLGVTTLSPLLQPAQGFGVEFLLSFVLGFTYYATVDPKRRHTGNEALPLGLCLTLLHLVGFPLTGCSLNPARSLGPAFVQNYWTEHWLYWAGPVAGAVVASLLYEFIFDPSRRIKDASASVKSLANFQKKSAVPRVSPFGFVTLNDGPQTHRSSRSSLVSKSRGHESSTYSYDVTGTTRSMHGHYYRRSSRSPKGSRTDRHKLSLATQDPPNESRINVEQI